MASPTSSQPVPSDKYNGLLEFQAGVTACLISWSAFRTAVESGWGGGDRESQKKAEDLRTHLFSKFDGKKCPLTNYDAVDLADDLAIYIEEEFSVTLEDDSERQLAEYIFRMYEDCWNGNPTSARQAVAQAVSAVALNAQYPVKVQTTEHDDDDDEEMESETAAGTTQTAPEKIQQIPIMPTNLADYVTQPMFGKPNPTKSTTSEPVRQLGESIPEEETVEMDDDGFAPVKKGNRRRR